MPIVQSQLGHQVALMGMDRAWAHHQLFSDLRGAEAFSKQLQDLLLSPG